MTSHYFFTRIFIERVKQHNVGFEGPVRRFDEQVLTLWDQDGLQLELVAHEGAEARGGWPQAPIPTENAIRGIHSVTLGEAGYESTALLLAESMGFRLVGEAGNRFRFEVGAGGAGALVDVLVLPKAPPGRIAVGTVHHVAWRTPGDEEQQIWRQQLIALGFNVTPVIDRQYFHSIYFHEPGGVLFEVATDPPGFITDERPEDLGTHLKLPPWLEPMRVQLERALPPLRVPGKVQEYQ